MLNVGAVDHDAPAGRRVEALNALGQGRFTGSRGADDRQHGARRHCQRDLPQDRRQLRIVGIADTVDLDLAAQVGQQTVGPGFRLGRLVHDLVDATEGVTHLGHLGAKPRPPGAATSAPGWPTCCRRSMRPGTSRRRSPAMHRPTARSRWSEAAGCGRWLVTGWSGCRTSKRYRQRWRHEPPSGARSRPPVTATLRSVSCSPSRSAARPWPLAPGRFR